LRHDVAAAIGDTSNELVARSVARGPKSAEGRSTLFSEEFRLYRTGSLLGRGPASTQANIDLAYGPIVKEAHDDYLATLVERGPRRRALWLWLGCGPLPEPRPRAGRRRTARIGRRPRVGERARSPPRRRRGHRMPARRGRRRSSPLEAVEVRGRGPHRAGAR